MSGYIDAQQPIESSPELPVIPSVAVENTWRTYAELMAQNQDEARSEAAEYIKTTYDFAGSKRLISSAYEAAHLVMLMEKSTGDNPVEAEAAKHALEQYESKNPLDRDYVRAVAADMVQINAVVDQHWDQRQELATDQPDGNDPTVRQYQSPWQRRYEKIPLRDVLELVSDTGDRFVKNPVGVNIESLLLAAATAYSTLRHSDNVSEDQLLETMYSIESFYQPVLEIIGYDAFSMALKREATLIRMSRNGGHYRSVNSEQLEVAREMIDQLPPPAKMPAVVADIMSKLLLREAESQSVLHDESNHGIQFGAGQIIEADIDDLEDTLSSSNEEPIRYVWRVKTDTSMARKVIIETGERAVDLLGVTVITPSAESLLDAFRVVSGMTLGALVPGIVPINSPGRDTPLHVKGSDTMIENIAIYSGDIGAYFDKKTSSNGHEVAKITLLFSHREAKAPIPVEIQFQTDRAREVARTGTAAHAFKDAGYVVSKEDLGIITSLHQRRMMTDQPGLTTLSEERAKAYFSHKPSKKTSQTMGAVVGRNFTVEQ